MASPTTFAGCVVFFAISSATLANAQVVNSFHDLHGALKQGERVTVTQPSGVVTNGRFVTLTDESLRILVESGRTNDFAEPSVARIDQLKYRTKKGAWVGFVGGFLGGFVAVALTPDDSNIGPSKAQAILPVSAIFGGAGALVGAIVGATLHEHHLIYLTPGRKPD